MTDVTGVKIADLTECGSSDDGEHVWITHRLGDGSEYPLVYPYQAVGYLITVLTDAARSAYRRRAARNPQEAVQGMDSDIITASLKAVSFNRDGSQIVTASVDGTARIWDVGSGKERFTLTGHRAAVETVAVSPDGKTVASASWDQTVKLWDAETGKEKATLPGSEGGVTPRPKSAPIPSKSVRNSVGATTMCFFAGSSATIGVERITEFATLIASEFAAALPLSAT